MPSAATYTAAATRTPETMLAAGASTMSRTGSSEAAAGAEQHRDPVAVRDRIEQRLDVLDAQRPQPRAAWSGWCGPGGRVADQVAVLDRSAQDRRQQPVHMQRRRGGELLAQLPDQQPHIGRGDRDQRPGAERRQDPRPEGDVPPRGVVRRGFCGLDYDAIRAGCATSSCS
jgi:hypothetical protein